MIQMIYQLTVSSLFIIIFLHKQDSPKIKNYVKFSCFKFGTKKKSVSQSWGGGGGGELDI